MENIFLSVDLYGYRLSLEHQDHKQGLTQFQTDFSEMNFYKPT